MDMINRLYFCILIHLLYHCQYLRGYGYDSASSCNPKMSRRGRAQLLATIPCDLTQQAYCNLPGSSYPWHAVRRFVHENQGLMKRMYGDIRHISILRDEIQNNEIDVEDIEATAVRYSKDNLRKTKYLQSEYQNPRTNDVLTEPHFRPTSTSTAPKTTVTITTSTVTESTVAETKDDGDDDTNIDNSPDHNLESNNIVDSSTQASSSENIKIVPAPNLGGNKTESATISTTLRVVQQIIQSEIESEQGEKEVIPDTELLNALEKVDNKTVESTPASETESGVVDTQNRESQQEAAPSSNTENKGNELFSEKRKSNKPSTIEGQLFQDTIQKDVPVSNVRGVNACPVKEEVVAPFWANNTRGEVLALLNLYPFEQYVHWEKCTHEHKQMYCRDGCRCEQQYRLHRLLAYDPHNECRGIFSDWFRFPSCCICKCYDIPPEFRATSRSPRASFDDSEEKLSKKSIDRAEDDVQRAIYNHATKDWYRPRDEVVDFYYD